MGVELAVVGTFLLQAAATAAISYATGLVVQKILGGPKGTDGQDVSGGITPPDLLDPLRTSIDPKAPLRGIIGRRRIGGQVTFAGKTDDNWTVFIHTLTGHPITSCEGVYLNNQRVTIEGNFAVVKPPWNGSVRVEIFDGTQTAASNFLLERFPSRWTAQHIGKGISYAVVAMKPSLAQSAFENGLPDITYDIRGAKLYDPRINDYEYSSNSALAMANYMTSDLGCAFPRERIDWTAVARDAEICDRNIARRNGSAEKLYSTNCVFDTSMRREDVLLELGATCAGGIITMSTKIPTFVGAWSDPSSDGLVAEADLVSDDAMEWTDVVPMENTYNGVRGKFASPADGYEEKDYPPYQDEGLVTQDGEELWLDVDFKYVTSPSQAQRLAKLSLLFSRYGITGSMHVKPSKVNITAGDMIAVSYPLAGWNGETFRVQRDRLESTYAAFLDIRRELPSWYAWDVSEEKEYIPGDPTLLSQLLVSSPGFSVTVAGATGSRTVTIDLFESYGAKAYQIEYKLASADTWTVANYSNQSTAVPNTVMPVTDGSYMVRAIAFGDTEQSEYTTSESFSTAVNGTPVTIPAAPAPPRATIKTATDFRITVEAPDGTPIDFLNLEYREPDAETYSQLTSSTGADIVYQHKANLKAYGWSYYRARARTAAGVYSNYSPLFSQYREDPEAASQATGTGGGIKTSDIIPDIPTISFGGRAGNILFFSGKAPTQGGPWKHYDMIVSQPDSTYEYDSSLYGYAFDGVTAYQQTTAEYYGWYRVKVRFKDLYGSWSGWSPEASAYVKQE